MTHMEAYAAGLNVSVEELASLLPCFMARCAGHFVIRVNRTTGAPFFGCSRYPDCTATRTYADVNDEMGCKVYGTADADEPYFGM